MSTRAPGRRLLILGAGAHARAVADVARACGWTVVGFLDARGAAAGAGVLGSDDDLPKLIKRRRFDAAVVGVGNTALARRAELFARLRELGVATPSLVHPSAAVSPSATIGGGSVVFSLVVVGADVVIGENAVLYSAAVVEHDCRIGDHVYLAPGVVICGNVGLDSGVFVGAGAIILPGVSVGKEAVIGAGARINTPVAAGVKTSAR